MRRLRAGRGCERAQGQFEGAGLRPIRLALCRELERAAGGKAAGRVGAAGAACRSPVCSCPARAGPRRSSRASIGISPRPPPFRRSASWAPSRLCRRAPKRRRKRQGKHQARPMARRRGRRRHRPSRRPSPSPPPRRKVRRRKRRCRKRPRPPRARIGAAGSADVHIRPHRQSRRDRLPHHPHRAAHGPARDRGLFRRRPQRAARAARRRGDPHRASAGGAKLSCERALDRRRAGLRRRLRASRLRLSRRERRLRAGLP